MGADVGGSRIKLVRVDGDSVVERHQVEIGSDWPGQLARELSTMLVTGEPVGVGVAGLVDHGLGTLHWAPHLSGVEVTLGVDLTADLGRPVAIDNDANCATRAEAADLLEDPILVVMVGTGIGAGLWTAGDVYRGRAYAGEVGHMMIEPGGRPCRCGRTGCWETRVSGWVLGEQPVTDEAIEAAGMWLGRGLLNLSSILDPEVIVVGGGVIASYGDMLLAAAGAEMSRLADAARPAPRVIAGRHGIWSGAIGAARLAMNNASKR